MRQAVACLLASGEMFGIRSLAAIEKTIRLAQRNFGEPTPVVLFLCAVDQINISAEVLDGKTLDRAIESAVAGAHPSREGSVDFQRVLERSSELAIEASSACIRPLDLACAAAESNREQIDSALRLLHISSEHLIEQMKNAGLAAIEDAMPISHAEAAKYAVVVTGQDFVDDTNRYSTLDQAKRAQDILRARIKGESLSELITSADGFILIQMPERLRDARSIEIREL
jgi:hypothetical protein